MVELNFFEMLFLLFAGHAIADFPLQTDFIATCKNRNSEGGKSIWRWILGAHSIIHGGIVFLITGSLIFGILETIFHFIIDFVKCDGHTSFDQDQLLHILCKVIWTLIIFL